jgi:hypothetical protein
MTERVTASHCLGGGFPSCHAASIFFVLERSAKSPKVSYGMTRALSSSQNYLNQSDMLNFSKKFSTPHSGVSLKAP